MSVLVSPRGWLSLQVVALSFACTPAFGQSAPKRLSTWLLEQPQSAEAYPLGLSWRVPEESVPQTLSRLELLKSLSGNLREVTASPESRLKLRDFVASLPVTGRVPVALADARWLEANPARDPVLLPGHTVVLPNRPSTVTVVTSQGDLCQVLHAPGREALDYLERCMPSAVGSIDRAWMAQPDGRVQRVGVASWNRQAQDEPAPGTWIWGPPRDAGFPDPVSQGLISFLATQGPAPDQAARPSLSLATPLRSLDPSAPDRSRNPVVTASDWGGVGLMQSPTARMAKTGHFSFNLSHIAPYTQGNTFFQPFDWMEAGFRYTNISNRLFGPADLSGDQPYKDKSIDVKFRLLSESAYVPEFAVGLRDVAGTGLFSGEYVVANKRTGNFDWSLGLGWGYLGRRGDIRNPLGRLVSSFDTRTVDVGTGGKFGFGSYFRGPAALFGGVQYQSPWEKLILKLEYDGNDYRNEPLGNTLKQTSPFNFGAVYRAAPWLDLSLGLERGNRLMFGVTLHVQLDGLETPKINDPPRIPVADRRPVTAPDWSATSRDIAAQSTWHVRKIDQVGRELRVTIDDPEAVYLRDRVDKIAAVLHRDAPASVDRFALRYRQRGIEVSEHVVDRSAWVDQQVQPLPTHHWREPVMVRAPATKPEPAAPTLYERAPPRFESGLGFDFQQTLGGPDGFLLFQISAAEKLKYRLRDDTWLQGTLRLRILDNYDKFKYTAPSDLPRVRTFLREYLTTSTLTMPNLQMTHVGKLGQNQFYSVYAGYLESMFAGVGAEWLYKRSDSRYAVGVDVNAVRQRNFEQDFGLRDYGVATGHATLYWDTGWNDVQAKVSVGRYLAGDFGGTLEVSRAFRNGVTLGAFATKTNVSAAQFGEGSFDKGIYLSIPFDAMLTRSSNSVGAFVWKPLTRDGGAMLARANPLHHLTTARNERALWYQPAPRPNEVVIPSDRREEWEPKAAGPEPYLNIAQRPAATQFSRESNSEMYLVEALYRQGFRDIKVTYDDSHSLNVTVANDRIRPISRAVGRAARTALRMAPLEAREIRVDFADGAEVLASYSFVDLQKLDGFYGGRVSRDSLAASVAVRYLDPAAREKDPLALLGDLDTTEPSRISTENLPGYRTARRAADDFVAAGRTAANVDWVRAGAFGAGIVLASSYLDKRGLKFAQDRANNQWLKGFNQFGSAIPWIGAAAVAAAALDGSDPRRSHTGVLALESAGVAFLASTGLKYLTGRARPEAGLGPTSFKPFSSQDAFPSRHAIASWALATPFALEYDSMLPYGAAAVAALARATRREHWVSDIVAGSVLGYGIGRIFWESSRERRKGSPRAMVDLTGIKFAWELD